MKLIISENKNVLAKLAAEKGADLIRKTISDKGYCNILLATGASQIEMLTHLTKQKIDWSVVNCFHMDEYINMPITHNASFRKYLKERFESIVQPKKFYYIDGEANTETECKRISKLILDNPLDVAFIGIGENSHLAFNDPPADFETTIPYTLVTLDERCKQQQFGEGWFENYEDVPKIAISISIHQIMQAKDIICTVPDLRKAEAVAKSVDGSLTPKVPASILQKHKNTTIFLDKQSSSLLKNKIYNV